MGKCYFMGRGGGRGEGEDGGGEDGGGGGWGGRRVIFEGDTLWWGMTRYL